MRGLPADSLVSPESERMLLVAFESVFLLVITKLPVGFFCRRPLLIYSSSVSFALSTVIEIAAML